MSETPLTIVSGVMPVLLVVRELLRGGVRLLDGAPDRIRHLVRVEERPDR